MLLLATGIIMIEVIFTIPVLALIYVNGDTQIVIDEARPPFVNVSAVFHLEMFLRGSNSNVSRNLEGQWIIFLISCKYFKGGGQAYVKGGQMRPPP